MVRLLLFFSSSDCCVQSSFQSHNGAIAALFPVLPNQNDDCSFNPTMVRLLHGMASASCHRHHHVSIPQWCDCCGIVRPRETPKHDVSIPQWCDCCYADLGAVSIANDMFQSHNGAIAAFRYDSSEKQLPIFQSHNGAIAASSDETHNRRPFSFQSHNGAIAARWTCIRKNRNDELSIPQWCDCCLMSEHAPRLNSHPFNPTMVRLLPPTNSFKKFATSSFQSHNGAIAANGSIQHKNFSAIFQSHNGAIAAPATSSTTSSAACFQSHNGAIAAMLNCAASASASAFQSHNGAIAAV